MYAGSKDGHQVSRSLCPCVVRRAKRGVGWLGSHDLSYALVVITYQRKKGEGGKRKGKKLSTYPEA
jgi:hypothetical protein